jgi:hypothetical protein
MSHHRLGNAAEARESLAKARRWVAAAEAGRDKRPAAGAVRTAWHSWNERAEVRALLREAEAALGVEGAGHSAGPAVVPDPRQSPLSSPVSGPS